MSASFCEWALWRVRTMAQGRERQDDAHSCTRKSILLCTDKNMLVHRKRKRIRRRRQEEQEEARDGKEVRDRTCFPSTSSVCISSKHSLCIRLLSSISSCEAWALTSVSLLHFLVLWVHSVTFSCQTKRSNDLGEDGVRYADENDQRGLTGFIRPWSAIKRGGCQKLKR